LLILRELLLDLSQPASYSAGDKPNAELLVRRRRSEAPMKDEQSMMHALVLARLAEGDLVERRQPIGLPATVALPELLGHIGQGPHPGFVTPVIVDCLEARQGALDDREVGRVTQEDVKAIADLLWLNQNADETLHLLHTLLTEWTLQSI